MTTDEIRIAMAELAGWKFYCINFFGEHVYHSADGIAASLEPSDRSLDDYLRDWNAVHRVVNALPEYLRVRFLMTLDEITKNGLDWFPKRIVESTPAQWCEAILRATGKWKE